MPLAYDNESRIPLVAALCDDLTGGVNFAVDMRDEMLLHFIHNQNEDLEHALVMYFHSGSLIWSTLRQVVAWWAGDLSRVGKLLDFASGYGRVTRFLVRDLPPGRVWISDIYADGVRFQEEHFGVHGLVSTADPADFACPERFDCVLASSLFTHLPERTFAAWLERLWSLLVPGGLLAFSVHDEGLLPEDRPRSAGGLLFAEFSESGRLDTTQYGSTWVSEPFVRSCLARIAPGASAHRIPKGLVNSQDLWVVVDRSGADFSTLDVAAAPEGYVEHCWLGAAGRVEIGGWVVDRITRRPVQEIRAEIGGAVVARCRDLSPREDVARAFPREDLAAQGWQMSFTLPPGTSRAATPLVLRMVDARGRQSVLAATTIDMAMLRSTRLDLLQTRSRLADAQHENARLGESEVRLGWEIEVLRTRLAAMEASRFWKLRNAWFAVKRRLGLASAEEVSGERGRGFLPRGGG